MMAGIDLQQLRAYVVVPSLTAIGLYSKAAERLVLATGLVESEYRFIDQIERGGDKQPGPARGLWQMEAATHNDLWKNFLKYKPELSALIKPYVLDGLSPLEQLHGNLYYAAIMCRVFYNRIQTPLPHADNLEGMAAYWKKYYNTPLGAGTIHGFMQKALPVMEI